MKSILKYEILFDEHKIPMHDKAEILSVQSQDEKVVMWVLSDDNLPMKNRTFVKILTGQDIREPNTLMYIGTVLLDGGSYAVHLHEKR